MLPGPPGWEPAGQAAAAWISPVQSGPAFVLRLVCPLFRLRAALQSKTLTAHCYSRITAQGASPGKVSGAILEKRDLDVQEFLRILAEIPDQQPHVPGQTRQIVI